MRLTAKSSAVFCSLGQGRAGSQGPSCRRFTPHSLRLNTTGKIIPRNGMREDAGTIAGILSKPCKNPRRSNIQIPLERWRQYQLFLFDPLGARHLLNRHRDPFGQRDHDLILRATDTDDETLPIRALAKFQLDAHCPLLIMLPADLALCALFATCEELMQERVLRRSLAQRKCHPVPVGAVHLDQGDRRLGYYLLVSKKAQR